MAHFDSSLPFSGEPDSVMFPPAEDQEEGAEPLPGASLTELHRLSALVADVDTATAVVPAGAYLLNDLHQVVPANDYKGLSFAELSDLGNFAHFRPAENAAKLRAMASDDVAWKNGSFLDTLTSSLPQGCWAKRTDVTAGSVLIFVTMNLVENFFMRGRGSYRSLKKFRLSFARSCGPATASSQWQESPTSVGSTLVTVLRTRTCLFF